MSKLKNIAWVICMTIKTIKKYGVVGGDEFMQKWVRREQRNYWRLTGKYWRLTGKHWRDAK